MMHQVVLRYILVALIVGAVLKYTPGFNLDNQKACTYVVIATALVFVIDMLFQKRENMESVSAVADPYRVSGMCNRPVRFPKPYELSSIDEDHVASFLRYDNDSPLNPLLQHNQFGYDLRGRGVRMGEGNAINLAELPQKICQSKNQDYWDQHNHRQWSPHTHVGKNRSYLNWQEFY